jgi:hypothetical protein
MGENWDLTSLNCFENDSASHLFHTSPQTNYLWLQKKILKFSEAVQIVFLLVSPWSVDRTVPGLIQP